MLIKKILLIRPGVSFWRKRFSQPLGLLYLISILRQRFPGQFEIELVEQAAYNFNFKQMREKIKKFNPDLVGFSCMSMEADAMAEISRIVKEINPKCITVLGGPHASVFYDYVLEKSRVDIVVIGEGEATFSELIQKLQKDEPIDNVNGIAFKKDDKIILTPPRDPIEDLDSIPFPAWDMIDFKHYSKLAGMHVFSYAIPWSVIFTSRGCPFHCAYCHKIFGKRTRFRSPENVIAEIELLTKKYGVKEIHIVDDIFNLDLARAKKICDLIVERGIKVKIAFPNGLRGDMMDKEFIHKLKQAGCYSIIYAIETASPRLQKLINKNLDIDKVRQAIKWANDEKIATHGFFMIGFPSETKEEIEKTIKWACDSELRFGVFFTVVLYPRQPLMEIAKKVYPNFDFAKWEMPTLWYWTETPFYKKATGIDLREIQENAYRQFHRKRIFSTLLHFPIPIKAILNPGNPQWLWRNLFMSLFRYKKEKSVFFPKYKTKKEFNVKGR